MRLFCLATLALLMPSLAVAQEPMQPTKEHLRLKQDVGTWTGKMTMQIPGSDTPMSMDIKETNTMVAGDLWLLSEFESGPFKGRGQTGYDTRTKKYVGTWIDNSSGHLNVMEGDFDEANNTLTMNFKGFDPMTGGLQDMKTVTKHHDKDKRSFVMYVKMDGKWVESFQMKYQRVK